MYNNLCHDINECHNKFVNKCDPDTQKCINTEGSFYCECHSGLASYLHNGLVYCARLEVPQDECDLNDGNGAIGEVSENSCWCKEGFYQSGNSCVDLNECHLSLHDCDLASLCFNTVGGFYCQCAEGFALDDLKKCRDIDECLMDKYICGDLVCVNTHGSYYCQCEEGGKRCEEDNLEINTNCQMVEETIMCTCDVGFAIQEPKTGNRQICEGNKKSLTI